MYALSPEITNYVSVVHSRMALKSLVSASKEETQGLSGCIITDLLN